MAKSENNEIMHGARGKVGKLLVFRNYYGQTIISRNGRRKKSTIPSEEQTLVKERFKEGVIYAKGVLQDQVLSNFYRPYAKDGVRIYNLALADFCKPPQIKSINTEQYQGNAGDRITIRAVDNFKVVSVSLTIWAADGTLIESGIAIQLANQVDWAYTTTQSNPGLNGTTIKAKAIDTPGNITFFSQEV
ncbi:hypothetical protein D9M68_397670 [compost metagenome]